MSNMPSLLFLLLVVGFSRAATFNNQQITFGTIKSIQIDDKVTIHQYEGAIPILVNSYIIELPTKLVVIDAQYVLPAAREFLAHIKQLNKPVDRIIVTHAHPDHYFGLEVLKGLAPIYALLDTIIDIGRDGQFTIAAQQQALQSLIPTLVTLPNRIQRLGPEVIDGILFNFLEVDNTDYDLTLVVVLPFQRSMFVGDTVFNQMHFYLADKYFDDWVKALKGFQRDFLFYNIFQGHGTPTTTLALEENIQYLEFAKQAYLTSNDFDTFKAKMVQKYPRYRLDVLLDYSRAGLYPNA